MNKFLYMFFLICLIGCSKDDEKIYLDVTDIQLEDIGQVSYEFRFDVTPLENGPQRCKVRTIGIKKDNTIEAITAYIKGDELNIYITSIPHNFDCNDESCLTVHELYFNVDHLEKGGNYNINLSVNGVRVPSFKYKFSPAKTNIRQYIPK